MTEPSPLIVGIDTASNRLHIVTSAGGSWSYTCPPKMGPDERRHQLFNEAKRYFSGLPQGAMLMVEEPIALQNGKTTRLLNLAAGAIWAAHLDFPIYWFWVDNNTWKRVVVGKGNAKKHEIRLWVQLNLRKDYPEEDFYDAACLMHYGQIALPQKP